MNIDESSTGLHQSPDGDDSGGEMGRMEGAAGTGTSHTSALAAAGALGGPSAVTTATTDDKLSSREEASLTKGEDVPKGRRKKKWKKPKGKPKRALSAYNLFFRKERASMLGNELPSEEQESLKRRVHCKTHGKIGFAEMARTIGSKWKSLNAEEKTEFEEVAAIEKARYVKELAAWKETQEQEQIQEFEQKRLRQQQEQQQRMSNAQQVQNDGVLHQQQMNAAMNPSASAHVSSSGTLGRKSPLIQQQQILRELLQSGNPQQPAQLAMLQRRQEELNFLASLQERRQFDQLLGRQNSGAPLLNNAYYPSAAEASASALMNQFQAGMVPPGVNNLLAAQQQQQQMQQQIQQQQQAQQQAQQQQQQASAGMPSTEGGGTASMASMRGLTDMQLLQLISQSGRTNPPFTPPPQPPKKDR